MRPSYSSGVLHMTQFDSSTQVASSASHSQETSGTGGPQSTSERVGIEIESTFCPTEAESPFDTTEWELRTAAIKGENGQLLFEQAACEIPAAWSQLATNVVVSKYFMVRFTLQNANIQSNNLSIASPVLFQIGALQMVILRHQKMVKTSTATWHGCVFTSMVHSTLRYGLTSGYITNMASRGQVQLAMG